MVHALKMGWMKPRGEIRKLKQNIDPNAPSLDLWKDDNEVTFLFVKQNIYIDRKFESLDHGLGFLHLTERNKNPILYIL